MKFAIRAHNTVIGYIEADSEWNARQKLGLVKTPGEDFYTLGNAITKAEPIILQELAELTNPAQLDVALVIVRQ